jgi:hypothetical protein
MPANRSPVTSSAGVPLPARSAEFSNRLTVRHLSEVRVYVQRRRAGGVPQSAIHRTHPGCQKAGRGEISGMMQLNAVEPHSVRRRSA